MPTELTIRAATPADGEGMRLVHVTAIGAVDPSIYPDETRESWAYGLRAEGYAYSMSQGEDLEVAIDGSGRILAFCGVKAGEVTGLYVHPDAQGAGLGTALLRRGEARAKARKPDAASLSLNASLNAVSFYERHGYVLVSIHERRTRDGKSMAAASMEKPFAGAPTVTEP